MSAPTLKPGKCTHDWADITWNLIDTETNPYVIGDEWQVEQLGICSCGTPVREVFVSRNEVELTFHCEPCAAFHESKGTDDGGEVDFKGGMEGGLP